MLEIKMQLLQFIKKIDIFSNDEIHIKLLIFSLIINIQFPKKYFPYELIILTRKVQNTSKYIVIFCLEILHSYYRRKLKVKKKYFNF